jgi:predicted RNase H-like HicB family nuclease
MVMEKDTARLEAFSSGMFAIALTLLIPKIHIPQLSADAAKALVKRWCLEPNLTGESVPGTGRHRSLFVPGTGSSGVTCDPADNPAILTGGGDMCCSREMTMRGQFTLEFWEDGSWYVGRLLEVPGVFSQGKTLEELRENIQEAYDLMVTQERPPAPAAAQRQLMELEV